MIAGRSRRLAAAVLGLVAALAIPALVSAHPLGNFTINHYAGIRVSPTAVSVDLVLDEAEIPTFQERQRLDTNGDGTVSAAEIEAERQAACGRLADSVALSLDGRALSLRVDEAGVSFLPGAGQLFTMRTVCELHASLARRIDGPSTIAFEDRSFESRIGWREIVVAGDGMTIDAAAPASDALPSTGGDAIDALATSASDRLTHYPSDLLSQPLHMRSTSVRVRPGGPALAPFAPPDAWPLAAARTAAGATPASSIRAGEAVRSLAGAIPGGVGDQLSGVLAPRDLTLPVVVASLLLAAGLGAAHAVSPGHGKTVMAAYLVGSRGTAVHAVGLGLVVTLSHTMGVLGLAAVTVLAGSVLSPDAVYPVLGLVSGGIVVAIGGWLLVARLRKLRSAGRAREQHHAHEHPHPHANDHEATGMHSHGGIAHSHVPAGTSPVTWRALFSLGLAGGLVPSASALLLLLGALATGRPAYGLLLVVAFGAGMAAVLAGVGVAMVHAGRLVNRLLAGRRTGLERAGRFVPVMTAAAVLVAGLVLTGQTLHVVF